MPRSQPPVLDHLVLPPEPSSASRARRMVAEFLVEQGQDALAEVATLLVSEVVTNAVVHAVTDIEVSCRSDAMGVRVETRDRSPVLPSLRHYDDSSMTGRGLGLVEQLADAWGVDARGDGKVVWFGLAGQGGTEIRPEPEGMPHPASVAAPSFPVRFEGLPVELVATSVQYGDALLREAVLVALGEHDRGGPDRQSSRIDLGPLLAAVDRARTGQLASEDVVVRFPVGAGAAALERLALADEAERMAREGALLTIPAPPEVALCRRWYLSQIGLQESGSPPIRWALPAPPAALVEPVRLTPAELAALDALEGAVIVADDANLIVYVNADAGERLGWSPEELSGHRLASIVPPELREAHLVGFTRYLLTGEPRLLGRTVQLPVLRRDGTRFDAALTIDRLDTEQARLAFRARIEPVDPHGGRVHR